MTIPTGPPPDTPPDPTPMPPMLLTPGRNHNMLHTHKDRAVAAGILELCELDTRTDPDPPCGTQHTAGTYYHLRPGKSMDHYHEATKPPKT